MSFDFKDGTRYVGCNKKTLHLIPSTVYVKFKNKLQQSQLGCFSNCLYCNCLMPACSCLLFGCLFLNIGEIFTIAQHPNQDRTSLIIKSKYVAKH